MKNIENTIQSTIGGTGRQNPIKVRCPQCLKLYRIKAADIHSAQPHFECVACYAQFSFDYSIADLAQVIVTRSLVLPQLAKLTNAAHEFRSDSGPELSACPKCKCLNPRTSVECFKCGVVLEKAQMMVNEANAGGSPSLVKMWQDLLHNYSDTTKHSFFIDQCEELQALPFALKKYQIMSEVQPQDVVAIQMSRSISIRLLSNQNKHKKQIAKFWKNQILILGFLVVGMGILIFLYQMKL